MSLKMLKFFSFFCSRENTAMINRSRVLQQRVFYTRGTKTLTDGKRFYEYGALAPADMHEVSASHEEARAKVRSLYRKLVRNVPRLLNAFDLDNRYPEYYMSKVKAKFYENRDVKDPRFIDMLRMRGEIDYQEYMNMWATKSHVAAFCMASPDEMVQTKYDSDAPAIEHGQSQFLTDFLKR